jgi:hypothetical protein
MTGSSGADSDDLRPLLLDMDLRTELKLAKGLRPWGLEGTVPETGVGCLFGPKGRRDRKDLKVGMAEGVLGVFDGGEGDEATERFRLLLLETLLVYGRRAEGIEEGKALRLGCAGMDEGGRWVAMMSRNS